MALAVAAVIAQATPAPTQAPVPAAVPAWQRDLAQVRAQFRSHRPPPPFVTYTLTRAQKTDQGYPDVVNTYTWRVWCRTSDRAALGRRVFRDNYAYAPEFLRPAFNEARDPGPPTADVFEPAPVRPRPVSEVPSPEPTRDTTVVIGRVSVNFESDYTVTAREQVGSELHLTLAPIRDRDRNRLRELFVDADTFELHKLIATDKLFIDRGPTFGATFTITMGMVEGFPVVTDIHGHIGDGYKGDGVEVDFTFRDIKFPKTLPDWYFNPRQYGQHTNDVPL
jgi:hypothetical protein